jgi:ubiquinone/menaquinone biosynthesis C-methylase UbiE
MMNHWEQLYRSLPLYIRKSIPQYIGRSSEDVKNDKYERYYEVVRKEGFLHLCNHPFYKDMHFDIKKWLTSHIGTPVETAIDLGCGVGHWSGLMAEILGNSRIIGVDLSYQMLKVAHDHWVKGKSQEFDIRDAGFELVPTTAYQLGNIQFIQADMLHLPLRDAVADLAISILTVDRVQDIPSFIHETHRILKHGGSLLLVSPFNFQSRDQWDAFHPVSNFLNLFNEDEWMLYDHHDNLNYFVPLDRRNNRVQYRCSGIVMQKR